jgi:OOP family OmpA-OmpF porin
MNTATWQKVSLCVLALALVAGCQTFSRASRLDVGPVVLAGNEQIIRDQLIILVDASGSMSASRDFAYEKALVEAFVAAMPADGYQSGLDAFAGVSGSHWLIQPLTQFDRQTMVEAADSLEPLGSLTPLGRAIRSQRWEMAGKGGRGALLVFSDGMATEPEQVLPACRDLKEVHGGELCIYTVQIGDSARGQKLLQDMATVNGCGKYYDGDTLNSAEAMHALVREIFIGTRPMPEPVPALVWTPSNIYFDNDSSVIAPKYDAELDQAAAFLKSNPTAHMQLAGHTDSNASTEYNQGLSERRVAAVKAALTSRGVDAAQLHTSAHSENMPAVPNTSAANRQMNRRVELSLMQ